MASDPGTTTTTPGLRHVFRHKIFAMVWIGAFISNIGNWMENGAASWAVASTPGISDRTAAFLTEVLHFADFLPALFLSLLAGVIADRVNLRRYLLWLQLVACILGAGLAAAYLGYATPPVVIAFTFAEGIVWALNGPPWLSVVPHLVPRPELPAAVAASSVQFNLARMIGPVVAGIVVAALGLQFAFLLNALTFLPLLLVLWKLPPGKERERPAGEHPPIMKDLSAGLRIVWTHPGLRRLSLMLGVTVFFAAPATGLLAPYVQQRMNGQSGAFGWLLGAIGLGALLGALSIRRVPAYYPRHHLIPLATCMAGICMLLFTLTRQPWVGFITLVGMGFFWLLSLNSTNAAMQLLAEDSSRGRVMSVMLLCNTGFLPLGHLAAAGLASLMSPEWVMRIMEGALVIVAAGFLLEREPAIDAMERQQAKLNFWQSIWEAITAQSHRPIPAPIREEITRETEAARGERVIG